MKRVLHLSLIGVVCTSVLFGCSSRSVKGDGQVTSQQREVKGFEQIKLTGSFVVHLNSNQSDTGVVVNTDKNIQPYVLTSASDKVLSVSTKKGYALQPTAGIQLNINTKKVNKIVINGNTTIDASGLLGDDFELDVNGRGTAVLKGTVKAFKVDVNGASHLNAGGLKADNVQLKINGAGQATVNVSKKLGVYIRGSGQVTYFGQPPIIDQEIYGGGKLVKG